MEYARDLPSGDHAADRPAVVRRRTDSPVAPMKERRESPRLRSDGTRFVRRPAKTPLHVSGGGVSRQVDGSCTTDAQEGKRHGAGPPRSQRGFDGRRARCRRLKLGTRQFGEAVHMRTLEGWLLAWRILSDEQPDDNAAPIRTPPAQPTRRLAVSTDADWSVSAIGRLEPSRAMRASPMSRIR